MIKWKLPGEPMPTSIRTRKKCWLLNWISSKSTELPEICQLRSSYLNLCSSSKGTFRSSPHLLISVRKRYTDGILKPNRRFLSLRKNLRMKQSWTRILKQPWPLQKSSRTDTWKFAVWFIKLFIFLQIYFVFASTHHIF